VARILRSDHVGTLRAGGVLLLQGLAFDDSGNPLTGRHLRWYIGRRPLGIGQWITVQGLSAGRPTIRLVATDTRRRTAAASLRLHVQGSAPAYLVVQAPARISATAQRVRIVIASTMPATFTIAGRHYRVNRTPRALTVPIHPGRSMLRLPCVLRSPGGTLHETYIATR
jgi:hypothetical protein